MKVDQYGQISISADEAFNALYSNRLKDLGGIFIDDKLKVNQYNESVTTNADNLPILETLKELDITIEQFDRSNHINWLMPKNYCPDLIDEIYSKCTTQLQKDRVSKELELFAKHEMFDLLFYLKYLVDVMRNNKIVWGVGRGSSVASYVLYLIGVHKIDSIKYDLDIHEFLKEK